MKGHKELLNLPKTIDHEWNTEEDGTEVLDIIVDEESFK